MGGRKNRQNPSRSSRKKTISVSPTIAIVGAGSLGTFLALALHEAGFAIKQIFSRDSTISLRRACRLSARVGARVAITGANAVDADLIWLCVPDREIRTVSLTLAKVLEDTNNPLKARGRKTERPGLARSQRARFAFHSSGALGSQALSALRERGIAIASIHPLMTFVKGSQPPLKRVPFAMEGDSKAIAIARSIVAKLGGTAFAINPVKKSAYHAWATMTSPLLIAFLATLEQAASAAGITTSDARRMSLPIIQQTLANYARLGSAKSFSGPIIRGDVETAARHLMALKGNVRALAVYKALARMAIEELPGSNKEQLRSLLEAR